MPRLRTPRLRTVLLVTGSALLARRALRRRIQASPLWPMPALEEPISGRPRARGLRLLVTRHESVADGVVQLRLEGQGLPAWDRTLAHELGHLVLGHDGISIVEAAQEAVEVASSDLIAYMLNQRTGCMGPNGEDIEQEAEDFAALLLYRLGRLPSDRSSRSRRSRCCPRSVRGALRAARARARSRPSGRRPRRARRAAVQVASRQTSSRPRC